MATVLALSLYLALFLSGASLYFAITAIRTEKSQALLAARNSSLVLALSLFLAMAVLIKAFLSDAFTLQYVAAHSSRTLSPFYKITALWGGQEGSLLLWAFILSLYIAAVSAFIPQRAPKLYAYCLAVLQSCMLFFLIMLCYISPPFTELPFPPADGKGLNPLLQNPWMVIHPPTLYIGYVGMAVPFAFCLGALLMKNRGQQWIVLSRKFTLFAWLFLGAGILLGARWAYLELGWGGYWGWDPVENASFMPWLMCTAFLHSVMITEYRQMLKVWNAILIIFAFALSIFGTFVTRSGILTSVHSFADSPLGPYFFTFLTFILMGSLALLLLRWRFLREDEPVLETYRSKEASFLFNNLIFAALTFTIFWGTLLPILSEAIIGKKITVGAPYFNQVTIPLFLILLLLTGVGPLLAWRHASWKGIGKNFATPAVVGFATGFLLYIAGIHEGVPLLSFSLSGFVLTTILLEFYAGVKARNRLQGEAPLKALSQLFFRNPRRYGGYLVHLGIVIMFVAATGEGAFKKVQEVHLREGETTTFQHFTIRFDRMDEVQLPHLNQVKAQLTVHYGNREKQLFPAKNLYRTSEQPTTEIALLSLPQGDLYAILVGQEKGKEGTLFRFYFNPLVSWLWIGGGIMFLGGLVTLLPLAKKRAYKSQEHASSR